MASGPKTSTDIQMEVSSEGSPLPIPMEKEDLLLNPNNDSNSNFATKELNGLGMRSIIKTKSVHKKALKTKLVARGECWDPKK